MEKIWSLYSGFADWKRRWIVIALLICVGGILWEVNDLLQENQNHPLINPGSDLTPMRFDENGDAYAIAKPGALPYAKIWSNPLTRISFIFMLALIMGSLVRGLTRGVVVLVVLILLTIVLCGQSSVLNYPFGNTGGSFKAIFESVSANSGPIRAFIFSYLEIIGAAGVGLFFGIFR